MKVTEEDWGTEIVRRRRGRHRYWNDEVAAATSIKSEAFNALLNERMSWEARQRMRE